MAMNPNWARWIAASVNKHFETYLVKSGLDFEQFFEGMKRKNEEAKSIIEVRQDGGYWKETTKNNWRGVYEINLLIQHALNSENYYTVWDLIGLANEAMSKPIVLFNYDSEGNGSQIGCLNIIDDKGEIITHFFGQIEPKVEIVQATVEAHFYTELTS